MISERRALLLLEGQRSGPLYLKAARRLGLHPITLSVDPTQYSYLAAEGSDAIQVDTGNLDALISECSRIRATYEISGITGFTGFDESLYATVGKLCRHFDLPGPNPVSIEQCCDKFVQRQLLAEAHIPMPAHRLATDAMSVESSAAEIGLPVVLKPAAGSGSSGVRLCRDHDELAEHTGYLLGGKHLWQSTPRILVEEFAQGPLYFAQIMGTEVVAIGAALYGPPPYFVCNQLDCPALLTDDEHKHMVDLSLSCLQALGLGWGPTNIEFRWTKTGPVVIEVNPRLAGAPVPELAQLAYGVDLVTEHIKLVIGDEWNFSRKHSQAAAARILIPERDGIFERIDGDVQAAAISGVAEVKLYIQPKTAIVRKGDYLDKIGHVVAASGSSAQTAAILRRAAELIRWSITPFSTAEDAGHRNNRDSNPNA
ncbi:acetyl-CoA carboxylase biotin carboxylase subunit family protein [Mesorhizobium sp. M0140]|uniref:ATP-grasp domain-containing protein n=1 Tax=Mesorhizobium sp. M0140 TaxID=2956893 RepID=UPI0033361D41